MTDLLPELYAALAKAHTELTNPKKDSKAELGQYSYKYASLGAILDHVRPVLAKHGLSIAQNVEMHEGRVEVTTLLTHAAGGLLSFGPIVGPTGNTWQTLGSGITYGRRYALTAALGIAAEDDDDAQLVSQRPKPERKPEPKPEPKPEKPKSDVEDIAPVMVPGGMSGQLKRQWINAAASEDARRYLGSLVRKAGYTDSLTFLASEECRQILGGRPSSPLVKGHASVLIDALAERQADAEQSDPEEGR